MTAAYLPDPTDALTEPFWRATRSQHLCVQRCGDCGYLRWPPGRYCPQCLSAAAEWVDIAPGGTLWSYTIYHRGFDTAFADLVPYAVAFVEMDDGPRMYGLLVGDLSTLTVNARVRAVFEPVTAEITLVRFAVEE